MRLASITIALLAATTTALAQGVASDPTPEQIKAAIADQKGDGCYGLKGGKNILQKATVACFTTPYSRVVSAAQAAKKKYQNFTEADATADVVKPGELHIHAFAGKSRGPGMANVVTVVITPKGSKDKGKAIQPTSTSETTSEYKNLMGASFEGRSLTAVFPLEALSESNEVHVVYDESLGEPAWCEDCKADFKLKNVK